MDVAVGSSCLLTLFLAGSDCNTVVKLFLTHASNFPLGFLIFGSLRLTLPQNGVLIFLILLPLPLPRSTPLLFSPLL
ncbi:hypothetical protein K438DRAFT_1858992 [Mycena galopus ATCC 62051]|nr:hypothetical protein K438DRAFT_1858992 [Mycena galopus ATCC 62051]